MKKYLGVLMAALLLVVMTIPAAASQDSPVVGDVELVDGNGITLDGYQFGAEELVEFVAVAPSAESAPSEDGKSPVGSAEITLNENVESVELVLHVPGVSAGDEILVMLKGANQVWYEVPGVAVGDGLVQVSVSESGVVCVLKEAVVVTPTPTPEATPTPEVTPAPETTPTPEVTPAPQTTPAPETTPAPQTTPAAGTNNSTTAPQTGEGAQFPAAVAAVIVFAAIAVVAGKKARA